MATVEFQKVVKPHKTQALTCRHAVPSIDDYWYFWRVCFLFVSLGLPDRIEEVQTFNSFSFDEQFWYAVDVCSTRQADHASARQRRTVCSF